MKILSPKARHVEGLIQLSQDFAEESEWARKIPIGRISTRERAMSKLFGPKVLVVRIAETESGEMVGYVGVYRNPETVHVSVLVKAGFRRQGVARQLVEEAFRRLPEGLEVEAWVGAFNDASLAAMPCLGFELGRITEDRGRTVHIFTRVS
jgi:ribosomal protein S18 acetylase RimI-like enzyme